MYKWSYGEIQEFLVSSHVEESTIHCVFRTPEGEQVHAKAPIKRVQSSTSHIERSMKRIAVQQARLNASRMIRRALGGSVLGRMGTSVVRSTARMQNMGGIRYTAEEKQYAIAEAFSHVSDLFSEKPEIAEKAIMESKEPVKKPVQIRSYNKRDKTPFARQLEEGPITTAFEQEIASRLMIEVAMADGNLSDEEKQLLSSFIPEHIGQVDTLMLMDPVSPVDCKELSDSTKDSIFMILWAMVCVDFDINPDEEDVLYEVQDMLKISSVNAKKLVGFAKVFALDQALYPGISRDELENLARVLQLPEKKVEEFLLDQ